MILGDFLLLLAALLFSFWGISIAAHDLNTCKIPNIKIVYGLKLVLLLLLAHELLTIIGLSGAAITWASIWLMPAFYHAYLLHFFLVSAFGILLWYCDIWPAGDAKFFIVSGLALPLINPNISGFPGYTFFFFIINIFVAAAFWAFGSFFITGLQRMERRAFFGQVYAAFIDELERFKKLYKGWKLLFVLSAILLFFIIQRTLSLALRLTISKNVDESDILFFTLFLLWDKLLPIFRKKVWLVVSSICYALFLVCGFWFFKDRMIEIMETAFIDMLKLSILIIAIRHFAVFLMEQADLQILYAEQLQSGMILSNKSRELVRGDPNFKDEASDFIKEGLSPLQVQILKDNAIRMRKKIPNLRYEVIKGRPFALWILLGAAFTLVLKDNIAFLVFR